MNPFILLFFTFTVSLTLAKENIIDILEKKDTSFNLQKKLKTDIGSVFSAEESFTKAFEAKNFEIALKIWLKSIQGTSFSKSSTGSALYSYLLFQNGFEVLSLTQLLKNSQPEQIDPIVSRLWKTQIDKTNSVWSYFYYPISPSWQIIFSPEVVLKIGSKSKLSFIKDQNYIKSLLALPISAKTDVFYLEWLFVLGLIKTNDMDSATKILAWFLSKTKNQYRKDKINLTIARLLADIGENQVALQYYKKIKQLSYLWFLAQEEMVWIYLNKQNESQAYARSLTLNYPDFLKQISSSMFFSMALSQVKNCDNKGAVQTLFNFKKNYLNKYEKLKKILFKNLYMDLIFELKDFYALNVGYDQINKTDLFYFLRKDARLKNDIMFFNYLKQKQKTAQIDKFKKLLNQEKKITQNLRKNIYSRIQVLLKKELKNIERDLRNFHLIETEILYREYAFQKNLSFLSGEKWYKDISLYQPSPFIYFPFNKDEIWLDEISHYKSAQNKQCPKMNKIL
ncbi:MAG: hypothetical protein OXC37_03820 [Bdellovibrionaceae bacterium]|nr:hypothetical protein [Pseudobdellovibrionaceae bacterium]